MTRYEYKVVPAPTKGTKTKGVKTVQGRFANSVETVLNRMGTEGWEYLRAELLPSDERSGLTGSTTNWRNVLVFRRALRGAETPIHPPLEIPAHDDGEDDTNKVVAFSHSATGGDTGDDASDDGDMVDRDAEKDIAAESGEPDETAKS